MQKKKKSMTILSVLLSNWVPANILDLSVQKNAGILIFRLSVSGGHMT